MDGLGKVGSSLTPGRSPAGSAGDGQGAFENFLASAIATIVTIIFSWRLLLDTQETITVPLPLEAAGEKDDKSEPNKQRQGHALDEEKLDEVTQVNIDHRTVSKVTLKTVTATSNNAPLQVDAGHNAGVTENGYKTIRASNHVNKTEGDSPHTGFVWTDGSNTCMDNPDQYPPASGEPSAAAVAKDNNHTSDSNSDEQLNPEGFLPRPSWALEDRQTVISTACIKLSTAGVTPSDSSGEEDTETEGDISSGSGSDSTLEYNGECDDDADQSESDNSLSNSVYSGSDVRELYLGDPLGDDDSDSEYCVVFNSMLEAITEEDTDDLSEIEREANENRKQQEKQDTTDSETDQVDSFIIPQTNSENKNDGECNENITSEQTSEIGKREENSQVKQSEQNSDSDSAINNDRLSEAESTSETNSIDVSIDTDAYETASSTSAVYGPIINTQRPLVIGPYRDIGSKFAQEQAILHTDIKTEISSPTLFKDRNHLQQERPTGANVLPLKPFQQGSYLERARAIMWGSPEPFNSKPFGQWATGNKCSFGRGVSSPAEVTTNEPNVLVSSEKVTQMERSPLQSFAEKIEDDKYDLDQSQSGEGRNIGERKDFNINVSYDLPSLQAIQIGQDDRSSTNADSDLDSLTECFDQFKKVALNHLEHTTTPYQACDNTKQPFSNEFVQDSGFQHGTEFSSSTTENSINNENGEEEKVEKYFTTSLSKSDFDGRKSLSDSKQQTEVVYSGSIDNLNRSDKLSPKFDDAPLSAVGRDERPAQSFTFVRTMDIERNFVLRSISRDKNSNDNSIFDQGKAVDGKNMQEGIGNMSGMSPCVSSTIGGLLETKGGPIAETTVGKFSVRPHPSYTERQQGSPFMSHHETGFFDQDQVKTTGTMYSNGSSEVGFQRNKDISGDLTGSNKHVQSYNTNALDQRYQDKGNRWDSKPQQNSHNQRSPERFDPKYFKLMQPYSQNGNTNGADSDERQLANRRLYDVDELADKETFDLSGNIVAYQDMLEKKAGPCHVVATSSAMARRGNLNVGGTDRELPSAGSAVASTEATSDNPYIAVARATARAATIASANAAAGAVATESTGPESSGDISVVVSTSCTIKEGNESKSTAPKIAYPETQYSSRNRQLELTPSQKKKMMITIEESQDLNRREYRTLECEVPKNIDGDVTAMISEAVKRIIASQSSLAHQKGNQLNKAIDQITRQVVSAYREPDSGYEEIPRYSTPPQRLALYDAPTAKSQPIPEFRAQNTPQLFHQQTPSKPAPPLPKEPPRDYRTRPGAYLSRVINKPGDPDKSVLFSDKDEKPVFYVTGKYPTADGEARATDDVVLKVVTNKDMQPSVEHVLLSESESDIETPLMDRKQYSKLRGIKEEDDTPGPSHEKAKKKKPARPKLTQPVKPAGEDLVHVPSEAWSVCTGCKDEKETDKDKSSDSTSPASTDKTIKGILKTRPRSTIESGEDGRGDFNDIPKSKSTSDVSSPSQYQPTSKPVSSQSTYQPLTKPKNKESSKKPYQSILLTPIKKNEKSPASGEEPLSPPIMSPTSEDKTFFFEENKSKDNSIPNDIPVAIPNTRPTRIDIEFEKRKREWRARTPSPKCNVVMMDIDIDGSKARKSRSKSMEDIKQRLSKTQLKAPSNDHIEKHWEGVSDKLSKSQDRFLGGGYRSREDSFTSDASQSFSMRRSTSMGTLPGQFFSDKRSYTSLIETDLDTGVSTEIPLIKETNIDEILTKSKSMTNLNTATSFRTYDIYNDDLKYKSLEKISSTSSHSSERDALNQIPIENNITERCRSAHELRISNSLNRLSLPPWFQATDSPAEKPVQLLNTKKPPRAPYELPPSDDKPKFRPKLEILPSKPIIISHRVSRSISKSPNSSTCSTPVGGPPSFELPSYKLRQSRETSLSPMPIKSPEEVPPLPPQNYRKKDTARDSYLKLKAKSSPESWEPLSALSRTKSTPPDVSPKQTLYHDQQSQPDSQHPTQFGINYGPREEGITAHRPRGQEEMCVSQKYVNLGNSENSSRASDPYAPDLPPRNYLGESSDSGVAFIEYPRYENTGTSPESTLYSPGRTVSNLVRDLKFDTSQISPLHDSGIDSASPDGAYKKMMTTLEGERQNIENKASEISSPYTPDTQSIMREKGQKAPQVDRNSFPVLSLSTSPGMKRRSFRSTESLKSTKEPEPSTVTMTFTRRSLKGESRNEATILDNNRKEPHSLDEVLGGLLAIPPPPGHPDDDEEEFLDDPKEETETPKERNFKILKHANTPRRGDRSLVTPEQEDQMDHAETEIDEDTVLVQCRNTKCGKSEKLSEARKSYKTCHNCFTYYCSRNCRKEHWEKHKRKCLFSRINSGCKHIIKKVQNSDAIAEELSKIARTGYLTKGRGCVMLVFPSPLEADKFLLKGFEASKDNPANYANIKDIQDETDVFGEHDQELIQSCKSYNPELKYVLEVAIVTSADEIPTWPIPRRDGPVIKKCAKVRLHSTAASKQTKTDEPDTLVLTAVPGSEFTENMEEKQAREICFVNIQRQLRQRGVSLRHQYPDIYKKLCAYVADNEHFTPISLYPMDSNTGKRFMCLIMPNSEPEVNWMYNPDLLGDLDLHTQV